MLTTGRRQVTEDVSEPTWGEEPGQHLDDQMWTTQERRKQQQHEPGNTRGCSEGVSGTDGRSFRRQAKGVNRTVSRHPVGRRQNATDIGVPHFARCPQIMAVTLVK